MLQSRPICISQRENLKLYYFVLIIFLRVVVPDWGQITLMRSFIYGNEASFQGERSEVPGYLPPCGERFFR